MSKNLLFILFSVLSFGRLATAATGCTPDGKIRYNQALQSLQICDGFWFSLDVASQPSTCTAADAGKQRFSSNVLQYCDGTNWNSLNNCAPTTVVCSKAGQIIYDEAQKQLLYCNGSFWVAAYGACGSSVTCSAHKDASSCMDDVNCMWSGNSCSDSGMNTNPGGPGSSI